MPSRASDRARHRACYVCGDERPGLQPDGRVFGPLPREWELSGRSEEGVGIAVYLTCSSACRFIGGFARTPFDT